MLTPSQEKLWHRFLRAQYPDNSLHDLQRLLRDWEASNPPCPLGLSEAPYQGSPLLFCIFYVKPGFFIEKVELLLDDLQTHGVDLTTVVHADNNLLAWLMSMNVAHDSQAPIQAMARHLIQQGIAIDPHEDPAQSPASMAVISRNLSGVRLILEHTGAERLDQLQPRLREQARRMGLETQVERLIAEREQALLSEKILTVPAPASVRRL